MARRRSTWRARAPTSPSRRRSTRSRACSARSAVPRPSPPAHRSIVAARFPSTGTTVYHGAIRCPVEAVESRPSAVQSACQRLDEGKDRRSLMSRTLLRVSSGWPRLASMLITLLGAAVAAAACSPTPAPTAAVAPKAQAIVDGVTFRLGWLYSGYDIPFFVAIDKGYYREHGLDVTINQGQGSGLTMQSVGGGQDTFGFVDASVAAVGIQKGVPIKMVAIYQQINPQALLVLEDSGIKTVSELDGKSVAVIPGANTTLFLPQFLQASGVDPAKVQLINTDPANLIPSFL